MKKIKYIALLLIFLSGCSFKAGDNLLKAPKPSTDYIALQNKIDKELLSGSVYAPPESGTNRNTIQLIDMDADSEEETVAFYRESSVSGVFNIVVYKKFNEEYVEVGRIKGYGNSIESVEYPKLSELGAGGIAVSFKIASQVEKALIIGKFNNGTLNVVLDTKYMSYEIVDIDNDGLDEIFTINKEKDRNIVNMYKMIDGNMILASSVDISREIDSISKVTVGELISGNKALAIDSRIKDSTGLITDLLTFDGQKLINLTIASDTLSGHSTYRATNTYTSKLKNDDILYVPSVEIVPGYEKEPTVNAMFFTTFNAYSLNYNIENKIQTYYTQADGYYFIIDKFKNLTIEKKAMLNTKVTVFKHKLSNGQNSDLFEIHTVAKEDYSELYYNEDYIKLTSNQNYIYVAKVLNKNNVTSSDIVDNFNIINSRD